MKRIILFSICSLFSIATICQISSGTIKTKSTNPIKMMNASVAQRVTNNNNSDIKLPDLTIISLDAQFVQTVVSNGITKHQVDVFFTVKNEGTLSILLNKIGWQGYIGYESANPKIIPGGGALLSVPATTYKLDPGEIYQGTLRVTAPFDKANRPLYTFYLDNFNDVNEINEQNNIAQKAIKF